jgi:class 3 adenylate cyclase
MRKTPLFPILFFLAAVLPFGFFLWKAPSELERHFTSIISNDPQNGLSQSLAALANTQGRLQNDLYLKALRIAASANVQKVLGKPKAKFEDFKWALGDILGPSPSPQLVISDSKGNALYNNMGLAVSTPSPTPMGNKKGHSSKPATPLLPSIKEWPGIDKALGGALQQGAFERDGHSFWGCYLPLPGPNKSLKVLALAMPLDAAWLNLLSQETLNDLVFYSQGQTLVTCQSAAPALSASKVVAPVNHPEKRTQLDWDGLPFLVDGISIPGIDGRPYATLALFQPVRKTVTVMGNPSSGLLHLGLLCLGVMTAFLVAAGWGYVYSMKQALVSIAGIKYGSPALNLPVKRFDEWGRMAQSLKEMRDRFKEKERISLILGKYMAPDVAKKILVEKNFFALEGENRDCAMMAVVVRQAASLEEKIPPMAWVETLNLYFTLIHDSVARHEGLMDYFQGYQAQAAWGVPFAVDNMAPKAAQAALEIMENLAILNAERTAKNEPTLELSIGLHTGSVVAGNIGSDRFYGYSVIGNSAETAKTLAFHAGTGQIIASDIFIRMAGDKIAAKELPPFSMEGPGEMVPYEIIQNT